MSELKKTLAALVRAKLGATLPLAELRAIGDTFEDRKGDFLRARADRANPSHRVTGRLVFASTLGAAQPKPLPYMLLELWDNNLGPFDAFLGAVETGPDGRFTLTYDPEDAIGRPRLELRVVDRYQGHEQVHWVVRGPDADPPEALSMGDVGVPYYEYHPEIPLPHLHTLDFGEADYDAMPQRYQVGRMQALAENAAAVYGVRLKHYTLKRDADLPAIQADYAGKTSYATPTRLPPGASADEQFVYKLLNGNCPTQFTVHGGQHHVVYGWDAFALDGVHHLPNVHATFDYDGAQLTPVSIAIQARQGDATAPHAPLAPAQVFRPGEPGWGDAKHTFECNAYVHTQAANHLARGHFNVEQFALAAWRNLRRSPLRDLLFPHLQEVMIINVEGESAIFGDEGLITRNSALTGGSLLQAILAQADTDWWGWAPRTPLGPTHHYAHVAQTFWAVLGEYVDGFFADHQSELAEHWAELRGFSDDLVAHSVPYRAVPVPEGHRWADPSEFAKPDAPRIKVGGVARMVTPIITADAPDAAQWANLKQACRYAIFHATLWHSWTNDTTDSLEPTYAQYNPTARSTTKELTDHIGVNLALSQTRYGMILKNEDGDLPKRLLDLLEARRGDFEAVGYDPGLIRSRINI